MKIKVVVRWGGPRHRFSGPGRIGREEKCKYEGSSGDVDENKWWQVSGVRCRVSGRDRE